MYDVPTGKTLLVQNAEDVCRRYAGLYGLTVKILRVPYLYSEPIKRFLLQNFPSFEREPEAVFSGSSGAESLLFIFYGSGRTGVQAF